MSHLNKDDGLPVLNAVVESGNESIIQSSRLGREVLQELKMMQHNNPVKFELQDHILKEADSVEAESQLDLMIDQAEINNSKTTHFDDEIEHMIDLVVDRHILELRRDIHRLLLRVKHNT